MDRHTSLSQLFNVNGVGYLEFLKLLAHEYKTLSESSDVTSQKQWQRWMEKHSRAEECYENVNINPDFLVQIDKAAIKNLNLLVLSGGWSDDAVEVLPVLAKLAEACYELTMKCIIPSHFPEIAQKYLPQGIYDDPQVIFINGASGKNLGTWGPRPIPLQKMVDAFLINPDAKTEDMEKALRYWYQVDQGKTIQEEITQWVIKAGEP